MAIAMPKHNRGFTLVELVVVIVLLGVCAVTFTSLITGSVRGYIDTANRQDSAAVARIALDRIGRELREALPLSVRVSADNSCIQFVPVTTSTVYTALEANLTSIKVIDFSVPGGTGFYAAVYPVLTSEVYALTAMKAISSFGSASSNVRTLTLASAFAAPRNSPGERLYIVSGNTVSYCFSGNQLLRYTSGIAIAQPTVGAGLSNGAVLSDKSTGSFRYASGNWQNNALVTINLTITQSGSANSANDETLQFDHEVWLRNVQ